jgi:BirA family biotin operon repressor/biotin-[acetyl-CoA-carboxylase] ligase
MVRLSGDLIRHQLRTRTIGQSVIYVEQTGSTNTELKRLARLGAPEGLLYIADEQLVGRGRLERSWFAPAGSSLLTSLLFKPGDFLRPTQAQRLTMACALAMVEAVESETGVRLSLKWPNDLMWRDGKKLGGVLSELEIEGERLSWVVVGLGLNVNVDFSRQTEAQPDRPGRPGSGNAPLAQTATSLSMILGKDTGPLRLKILQAYLEQVERRYEALKRGLSPYQEWQERLMGVGQQVNVTVLGEERYEGRMVGVDEDGALRLEQGDGGIVTILAGEVTLRNT